MIGVDGVPEGLWGSQCSGWKKSAAAPAVTKSYVWELPAIPYLQYTENMRRPPVPGSVEIPTSMSLVGVATLWPAMRL